jgi:hypothetical protein
LTAVIPLAGSLPSSSQTFVVSVERDEEASMCRFLRVLTVVCVGVFAAGVSPALGAFPGQNGKIVFDSERDGDDTDVWTMNPNGSNLVNLTADSAASDLHASGRADGRKIVFMSDRQTPRNPVPEGFPGPDFEIFVMNADGSSPTQITFNDRDDEPLKPRLLELWSRGWRGVVMTPGRQHEPPRRSRRIERLRHQQASPDRGAGAVGGRLWARSADGNVRLVAAAAGLQLSAHACLTGLVRRGNDLVMVAELAGHQKVQRRRGAARCRRPPIVSAPSRTCGSTSDHNRGVPPRQDPYAGGHSGSARRTSRARLPEEPAAVIE